MKKRKKAFKKTIILTIASVIILMCIAVPAEARTKEQLLSDLIYLSDQITILEDEGKYSNDEVTSVYIDLSDISTTGSVAMTVYESVYQNSTATDFTVSPMSWKEAEQQLVKYILGNIANLYKLRPYYTDIRGKTYDLVDLVKQPRSVVSFYIRGPYKAQAAAEIFNGIPDCFEIKYHPPAPPGKNSGGTSGYSGSSSVPVEPIPTPITDYGFGLTESMIDILETFFSANNVDITVVRSFDALEGNRFVLFFIYQIFPFLL